MAGLAQLPAAKLEKTYARRSEASSAVTRACIAAGMGNWRPTDRDAALRGEREATPEQLALCTRWRDTAAEFFAVVDEMDERKRWHGSLRPIRRAA